MTCDDQDERTMSDNLGLLTPCDESACREKYEINPLPFVVIASLVLWAGLALLA